MSLFKNLSGVLNPTGLFKIGKVYTEPVNLNDAAPKGYSDIGFKRKSVLPDTSIVIPTNHQMIRCDSYLIDADLEISSDAELCIL